MLNISFYLLHVKYCIGSLFRKDVENWAGYGKLWDIWQKPIIYNNFDFLYKLNYI